MSLLDSRMPELRGRIESDATFKARLAGRTCYFAVWAVGIRILR